MGVVRNRDGAAGRLRRHPQRQRGRTTFTPAAGTAPCYGEPKGSFFGEGGAWCCGWCLHVLSNRWSEGFVGYVWLGVLVERRAREHDQDDVAAWGVDDGGVVKLALAAFAVVAGLGGRRAQGRERGEEYGGF